MSPLPPLPKRYEELENPNAGEVIGDLLVKPADPQETWADVHVVEVPLSLESDSPEPLPTPNTKKNALPKPASKTSVLPKPKRAAVSLSGGLPVPTVRSTENSALKGAQVPNSSRFEEEVHEGFFFDGHPADDLRFVAREFHAAESAGKGQGEDEELARMLAEIEAEDIRVEREMQEMRERQAEVDQAEAELKMQVERVRKAQEQAEWAETVAQGKDRKAEEIRFKIAKSERRISGVMTLISLVIIALVVGTALVISGKLGSQDEVAEPAPTDLVVKVIEAFPTEKPVEAPAEVPVKK